MRTLKDKTAIVGIGATEFSKNSGRSEMQLAVEAVTAALADAGIAGEEVDGIATYTMDNNMDVEVARLIGSRQLSFFTKVHHGGGAACAPLQQAAMAIATGVADVVVCYRAMNERSEYRFGRPAAGFGATSEGMGWHHHAMHGLQTPAALTAMGMRRYMHETGTRAEDFAPISIAARKHAATNPKAFFYGKPITFDDYMSAKKIADPLRLLDCCQESDGAVAVVVTSAERARSLRQKPVMIRAASQSAPHGSIPLAGFFGRSDITAYPEVKYSAEQLYRVAELTPADIDLAIIYDHFGPTVLPGLEAFGFCKYGEAKDFIKDGNIEIGGSLPINTHGGQLGEAYIHGMNGVAEAVRQIRGTAVNQVPNVQNIVVTAGSGVPTSGVILGA